MKKLIAGGSLFVFLLFTLSADAANKWWDINGAAAGSGQGTATGTWNTTGQDWTTDSNGLTATTTFATGDVAIFSAGTDATGAFSISTPNAVTAGGLTVNEGTVSLIGVAAVTIGTGTVTVNNGATLSIPSSAYIAATAGATLVLNGGTMQDINPGSAGSFISPAITITLGAAGGTLSYTVPNVLDIVQTGTPGTTISGPGSLTKTGAGVLAIATTGSYLGSTTVNNGELRIRTSANRLPVTTDMTVTSPGILNLNGLAQQIGSLSGNGTVGLGNTTLTVGNVNNTVFTGAIVDLSSTGSGGVTSGHGNISKQGSGTLTLSGANTYSGTTTVSVGTLALGAGGSINDTTTLSLAAGATFDVSAISSYASGSSTTLSASGAGAPATINGGSSVSLGSQPITLTYDGSHPALTISQGTLSLNGNPITINASSHLMGGVYTVIQQTSGAVAASGSFTVAGTAIGAGYTASIQMTNGNVNLVLTPAPGNISSVTNSGPGTLQLNFSGTPGQNYLVQATTNLAPPIIWTTLSTNTAAGNGTFQYNDVTLGNYPARFYHTTTP